MESMTVAVAINARLFARLREQAGMDSETVHVPQRSTARDVYAYLHKTGAGVPGPAPEQEHAWASGPE